MVVEVSIVSGFGADSGAGDAFPFPLPLLCFINALRSRTADTGTAFTVTTPGVAELLSPVEGAFGSAATGFFGSSFRSANAHAVLAMK